MMNKSDFSNLKIHTVQFENIGNDAIDGSGSNIEVINSSFYKVQDKAISAGENSWFYVTSSKFLNNEIALVAKDGSLLISKENTLLNNRLDLVAFKKKKIFGPPSVEIINTTIKNRTDAHQLDSFWNRLLTKRLTPGDVGTFSQDKIKNDAMLLRKILSVICSYS